MTEKAVRWGILGTGGIASTFATDLLLVPGAELSAVGSRTPEAAAAFAGRHGFARAHGSWAELAADPDVDVIYVATPHAAHFDAAMTCLEGGKAVLCEKPMTLDLPSSQALVQEARTRGLFLMEAMWMRLNPAIRRIVELIGEGAIGEVTNIHADFGLQGPFEATHRLRDPAQGGGALLDLGVYPLNLAHLILGRPAVVRSWARLTPEGVDDNTGILLGWDSGALAALSCSLVGETRTAASITGTLGRIDLPQGFFVPRGFVLHRVGEPTEEISYPFPGNGYQYEAAEVQRCLAEGLLECPLMPHATTLEIMGLMDSIRAELGVVY
ncbi:Gfo/Idh/MocA family protein [Amorphoplanes digitatis]|uniref:Putative dehydrogenase n=1 Tax=Actinoplanes digitatis TaxID=1868 RepID=A0A7W7HRR1_9ACTN|nr:Gfo/Idh/MocA family oxidoreductase [Actinoplanes digitatis]MBB4759595.1 putative dehydrogenase [Actinoplanes digitatis]BFE67485.1 Gfo/Idh/MocA family oxidoreductase [Actinoplanes digitatis]GID96911.1 oxidoreductase [Actinoplanes digitatis]